MAQTQPSAVTGTAGLPQTRADYWSDKTVFARVGALELASIEYEVRADFSKPIVRAFSFIATLRALGVYLGRAVVDPLCNGAVEIDIAAPIGGSLKGRIDNFAAVDAQGAPVRDPSWSDAALVSFLVTGTANAALPVSAIVALVPGLGWLAHVATAMFGSAIVVNFGHKTISLPIHRDASGKPVMPQ